MAVWPLELPALPLHDGYQQQAPDVTVRTEFDAGPAQVRRRASTGVRQFSLQFILDNDEIAVLEAFYYNTLEGGALAFDYAHPRTGVTGEFRFLSPPSYQPVTPEDYRVAFQLELLP